ncbi:helix-turn-helix domain-containing protein [Gynuella sp.]|uniref:helix-turn-helix domain-containing protein n=1 Tax=Gynuella sp. TaxID=2969146 RepID=UPI003D0EA63C
MNLEEIKELREAIGARIKQERKRLGLNQAIFGEMANAKNRTVIDWEKGVSTPTGDQLACLEDAGVDLLYVLTGTATKATELPVLAPDEELLLEGYRKMGSAKRRSVLEIVIAGKPAKKQKDKLSKILPGFNFTGETDVQVGQVIKSGAKNKVKGDFVMGNKK